MILAAHVDDVRVAVSGVDWLSRCGDHPTQFLVHRDVHVHPVRAFFHAGRRRSGSFLPFSPRRADAPTSAQSTKSEWLGLPIL